jgi:VWFA-related protein
MGYGFRTLLFCLTGLSAAAQTINPPPQTAAPQTAVPAPAPQTTVTPQVSPNAPETVTHDEPATFKARVNLVMVPVVVRDKQGKAVGGLHQEDFLLFDKGKPQTITRFTSEKGTGKARAVETDPNAKLAPDQPLPPDAPDRFVAYMFDDIHMDPGDVLRTRESARKHMASLGATERAAIYTTSGQVQQEFTDDRDKLYETLRKLMPRPIARPGQAGCPDISYYMADMMVNHNDQQARAAATAEAAACLNVNATDPAAASTADAAARMVLPSAEHESRIALQSIRDIVRRMSSMPGQRTILLTSPGFLTQNNLTTERTDAVDMAIKSNVVISTVDARGLYTDSTFDASEAGSRNQFFAQIKNQYQRLAQTAQGDILAELALGTGGNYVHNNNDIEGAYKEIASLPEYYYILGFSPQNLKLDGTFHALKVSMKDGAGLNLTARRGFYAPKHLTDAQENAKEELREAVFSREEMHELPIDLHTQFFKANDDSAKVSVMAHVDIKRLKLRKQEGRNYNALTIVSALFDRNGNYVTGNQKLLEMRLKDETLEKRSGSGLTVRSQFDVKPGIYIVRLVVRDAEGQQMSAANGSVEIP